MNLRPLLCPVCSKNDWTVFRALNTGAFALGCNPCRVHIPLGVPRDVPTLDAKTAKP